MRSRKLFILALLGLATASTTALANRGRYNFNPGWHYLVADQDSAEFFSTPINTKGGIAVTLPHAWNEDDAYSRHIKDARTGIVWYYKDFELPAKDKGKHIFLEFGGARQCAEVWVNRHRVGMHENGVTPFGFDITPYIHYDGLNEIAIRTDNSWDYRERATNARYQWNDKNFNLNMGGLNKNLYLHVTGDVYQTLPLYSNLGTVGVYAYASDFDIPRRKARINVESQVINSSAQPQKATLQVAVTDADGRQVAVLKSQAVTIAAGDTALLQASKMVSGLHFWSWGYGYLYTMRSSLIIGGKEVDNVSFRTGFRKTRFADGKIWLNDRVMMVHGYAQRTSNEWPSIGTSIPAWLSDYSNRMMVESGANLVRWMHITPSRQDVSSCDRVGLPQAMPAGDAEKDREGRQWEQRKEVMRDAIISNRNSPSILFYESGNESISREHMIEMRAIRDQYDPHGGRAIGSREMLDIEEAEYGGEMLYINKSGSRPMWAMEYSRDEGYRMYWDEYSYPYHAEGAGPYYRKQPASEYNHNMDNFAVELIRRWHDYYSVRPGMGKRVSSGGVKIIFSDTNTHNRSEFNYRTSGVVDAMRIPKDAYFATKVMWDSWCDVQHKASYIIGHWNYPEGISKNLYVVSTSPIVELFVNDKSIGRSTQAEYSFLHTFQSVNYEAGTVRAVSYAADGVTVESEYKIETAGPADHLKLTLIQDPNGMKADGADVAIVQIEVVDKEGRRCPLDNRQIFWNLRGVGEWRGGIFKSPDGDNGILSHLVPVEAGVGRVIVRSTNKAGLIRLHASACGLAPQCIEWNTKSVDIRHGVTTFIAHPQLPLNFDRGETPSTPSYTEKKRTVAIASALAGANGENAGRSFDDNELSEWKNDGRLSSAWITYELAEAAAIDEISLKLTGWRKRSYPIEVYADDHLIWQGLTPKSLGYVSLKIKEPVKASKYTIRQVGSASEKDDFSQITELAGGEATELDLYKAADADKVKGELRIVEIDFLQNL